MSEMGMDMPVERVNLSLVDQASLTVAADVACIKCEYNLRMLKIDGVCPECGWDVGESLRSDALWLADPSWLGRLRVGFAFVAWGMAGVCVLVPLGSLSFATTWRRPMHTSQDGGVMTLVDLMALLCLATLVALPVGVDRVLAAEPGETPLGHKRIVQLRSLLSGGLWLLFPLLFGIPAGAGIAGYSTWVMGLMFALAIDAFCLGFGVYLRWLAARACDLRTVRCVTGVIWLTGGSGGIALFQLLSRYGIETLDSTLTESGGPLAMLRWVDGCGWHVCGAFHLAALVSWTVLMILYGRLLSRVVSEAEKARKMEPPL